ncbi:MAG TPA: TonB-dependent receptor [Opitutaceae bacterium]|nr:TonB-dependent receptor [Opitutaceae bacterium]
MLSRSGLLAIALSPLAQAQTAPASSSSSSSNSEEVVNLSTFVVTGVRASLATAQEIKQEKAEIVDSIVASDITKLPDYNVTDALQRITGIQVLRDRGEGAGVTIRGLTQMEHTLNGREIFTAGLSATGGASRQIDFADVPSEMVAGINVYKTSSADQLEGGIGGLVEMYTRRPFDFKGFEAVGSVRLINGDLVKKTKPQYSALVSDRIKLPGGSELGALINVTYQERAWREDQKGTGTPTSRTDIIPGQTVNVENSTTENTVYGTRKRTGLSGVLQWKLSDEFELYADSNYTKFDTLQDTQQINLTGAAYTFVPGSAVLAPGTNDLQKITWTNASVSVLSFARDTHDWTKQFGGGAIWKHDALQLKLDLSYTDSYNDLFFSGPFYAATAAEFTHDLSTEVPSTSVSGTDLKDPSIYRYTGIAYRFRPFYGDLKAGALDGSYTLRNDWVQTVSFGARYALRNANNKPGLIFADFNYPAGTGPLATSKPDLIATNTAGFFPGTDTPSIREYMIGKLDGVRDAVAYRNLFGITTPLPASASPLTLWDIDETTMAGYVMAKFKLGRLPLDGNIGVRGIRTKESVEGTRTVPATPTTPQTTAPLDLDSTYNNVLPSLNLRYTIASGLFLKGSASKTLTRPDFGQLSPSLTLVPNPVNPALNSGSAGNPDLRPIRSRNLDVAIEKYFNRTTSIYATFFYKKVDGFIVNSAETETYDGQDYLITRPRNANPATIKGFEFGYTQFFDFLPAPLRDFGVQANYTYIDSETPNATLGINTPLPNLSRNSYNAILMYETKSLSIRLAYNWRDKFLSGQANIANVGRIPFYTKAYGWLDASVSYRFNDHLSLGVEGTNLLSTKRISYYGVETRPQNVYINDLQISGVLTYRF